MSIDHTPTTKKPRNYLANTGWLRFAMMSTVAGTLFQIVTIIIISLLSVPKNDWYSNYSPAVHISTSKTDKNWIYEYTLSSLIVPQFDMNANGNLFRVGVHMKGHFKPDDNPKHVVDEDIPKHSRYSFLSYQNEKPIQFDFVEDLIGFPFLSARSFFQIYRTAEGRKMELHDGYLIRGEYPPGSNIISPRELAAIPLRPLFPGFLYNTLIYSIPFAGFILSLRWFRVWKAKRRVRRGRCVACGYDITGLDRCPECATWKDIPWKPMLWAGCRKSKFKLLEPEPLPNEPRP